FHVTGVQTCALPIYGPDAGVASKSHRLQSDKLVDVGNTGIREKPPMPGLQVRPHQLSIKVGGERVLSDRPIPRELFNADQCLPFVFLRNVMSNGVSDVANLHLELFS